MYKGIDVSSNNGVLDWDAIKNDGIEFAIIRIGYGSDDPDQDDNQAIRNMDECERLGIPYGVYIYSYALNPDNVSSEVQHTLRMIQGRKPSLGVWFDMEDADGYKARNGLIPEDNSETLTQFCNQFCAEITSAGYIAGVYANMNYFDNILGEINYDKWLAIWGPDKCPEGNWKMWQYTSDGVVNGSNARTDMNYYFGEIHPVKIVVGEIPVQEQNVAGIEPQSSTETYTVQPGDTLSDIAARYGRDYMELAAANGITNPDEIYPGDVIHFTVTEEPQTEQKTYTVQSGDTLSDIAARYGTDYHTLAAINGIPDPDEIYPGNVLILP